MANNWQSKNDNEYSAVDDGFIAVASHNEQQ